MSDFRGAIKSGLWDHFGSLVHRDRGLGQGKLFSLVRSSTWVLSNLLMSFAECSVLLDFAEMMFIKSIHGEERHLATQARTPLFLKAVHYNRTLLSSFGSEQSAYKLFTCDTYICAFTDHDVALK